MRDQLREAVMQQTEAAVARTSSSALTRGIRVCAKRWALHCRTGPTSDAVTDCMVSAQLCSTGRSGWRPTACWQLLAATLLIILNTLLQLFCAGEFTTHT